MVFSASKEERRPEDSIKSTVLSLYRFNLPKTQKTILRMTNIWKDVSLMVLLIHTSSDLQPALYFKLGPPLK